MYLNIANAFSEVVFYYKKISLSSKCVNLEDVVFFKTLNRYTPDPLMFCKSNNNMDERIRSQQIRGTDWAIRIHRLLAFGDC